MSRRKRGLSTDRELRIYDALIERYLRYRRFRDHTIAALVRSEAARMVAIERGDPTLTIQITVVIERERLAGIRDVIANLTEMVHEM
jgi:hypothetical protein